MRSFPFFALLILSSVYGHCTHLLGGNILYERINSNTVNVTFIGYRNADGVPFGQGVIDFGDGDIFGDETDELVQWKSIVDLGGGIEKWEFTITHIYYSPGYYLVSYAEEFRSANVLNVESSESAPFYVEALISVDPILQNTQPSFNSLRSFKAISGETFTTNFSAFDSEKDSLSYQLVTPGAERGQTIENYLFPNGDDFGGGAFSLGVISGNLVWNKPSTTGYFSLAIKVSEWREVDGSRVNIGYTVFDFIVEVIDAPSGFLEITGFESVCQNNESNFQGFITIDNTSTSELGINFESEINSLKIDGLNIDEWNNQNEDQIFTGETIEFNVSLEESEFENHPGFNDVIINVSGAVAGSNVEHTLSYRINSLLNFACDEDDIVTSIPSLDNLTFHVGKDGIVIQNYRAWGRFTLYDLAGNSLINGIISETKGKIGYPFIENTVYLFLVENSQEKYFKKFVIKED